MTTIHNSADATRRRLLGMMAAAPAVGLPALAAPAAMAGPKATTLGDVREAIQLIHFGAGNGSLPLSCRYSTNIVGAGLMAGAFAYFDDAGRA